MACSVWFAAAAPGCSRGGPSDKYIAQVGTARLTSRELAVTSDSLGIARGKTAALVNEWIVEELLYQEAQRRGLTETDKIRRQLESARKHLAIEALLDEEVYDSSKATVTEKEVSKYFTEHTSQFTLHEDVARLSYAQFAERDAANQFRGLLLRGSSWDDAIANVRKDSLLATRLRAVARNQFFTQATLFPEELWKMARTLSKDEVSFVVRAATGYYVIVLHDLRHTGESPDFEYVRQEVRDRLLIERRRALYEKLVADLRLRQPVEVFLNEADSGDTKE
jgi:hypothetical protein